MGMLRRITDQTLRSNSLGTFGINSEGQAIISLNEFTYVRTSEIFGEKETAEYVYQIKTGAVRTYKLLSDGRRQIGAFHLPGDIFGLVNGGEHRFTAEAIVDTTVRLIKRHSLETFAVSDPMVAASLLTRRPAISSMQKIICFCWGVKTRWRGSLRFLSKWTRGWPLRLS